MCVFYEFKRVIIMAQNEYSQYNADIEHMASSYPIL